MKNALQTRSAEELIELYEELAILLSQLNEDAPKIKKMYDSLKQTVAKQDDIITKSTQSIEETAAASIAKVQKETKTVLDTAAQYVSKAESVSNRCEAALIKMEVMVRNLQFANNYQLSLEKRLGQIEAQLKAIETYSQNSTPSTPRVPNTHPPKRIEASTNTTLSGYFRENGFKVIDYRTSGGALWVIGSKTELGQYVDYAVKHFGINGRYGSGRATDGKPAWWTKDDK